MSLVRITDVSPRDGLQNEPGVIPSTEKSRLVDLLAQARVDEIEVTSFVSAKWVPQLGDAAQVLQSLAESPRDRPMLSALVPNEKGLEQAMPFLEGPAALGKLSVFAAASETFSRKNTNASIAEVLGRFVPIFSRLRKCAGPRVLVRGYISCVIACPFEGVVAPSRVIEVARMLIEQGVDEIDLGDTIGAATRDSTRELLSQYDKEIGLAGPVPVTLHLHDTFGKAADCVREALQCGVRSFDGAVGGLGGFPYASTPGKRAPGNIDTTLLVRTVRAQGFSTSVDEDALAHAAAFARGLVGRA
jgi:hydroxymethylglutaryl-CoA lyase